MINRFLVGFIALFLAFSGRTVFTVHAANVTFGNLPLVNSTGSAICVPIADGTWDISFSVPAGQDYVLNDVQFVAKLLPANPPVTISGDLHRVSANFSSSVQLALFSSATVSSTSSESYTLTPNSPITLEGGAIYVVQLIVPTPANSSCDLALELSDTPPVGTFSYIDNIAHQIGSYIGFQLNATSLGSEDGLSYPPDDRFNWQYGDSNIGVLYITEAGVGLYEYSTDSYVDFLFAEDIAPYLENLPTEPVLLAEYGLVRAYLLPTGEIQFNLGPDAEGKSYVYIIPSLDNPDGYGYYDDPNE